MATVQKIVTHLWFDDDAEEAISFYISLFDDSRIVSTLRYGKAGPGPEGTVMSITFELAGQRFMAVNGGPLFKFSEAISLFVRCEGQAEVDRLWNRLLEGGQAQQCGWLKDRHGLSWQIAPAEIEPMLHDPDPERANRVMAALLQMVKLDAAELRRAYESG